MAEPTKEEKIESLMTEAIDNLSESKEAFKAMSISAKEYCDNTGIFKPTLMRCKDYSLYKKNGWAAGDPLASTTEKIKHPDIISAALKKLVQIIDDLQTTGTIEELKDYQDALEKKGIHLTIDDKDPKIDDKDAFKDKIRDLKGYQITLNKNSEEFTDTMSPQADDLGICPKEKFKEIVQFKMKKDDDKDIEDAMQDRILWTTLYETGLNYVHDGVI